MNKRRPLWAKLAEAHGGRESRENKRHKERAAGEEGAGYKVLFAFSAHRRKTECQQEVIAVEEAEAWRRLQ